MKYLIDDQLEQLDLDAALALMPEERRRRTLAYRHESQRRQSAGAWLLLRRLCREEWGLSDVPEVRVGEHGKPYFPDRPDLHFNLSHCAAAAACVVDTQPVGIDIETVRPLREALARRVLSEQEWASLKTHRPSVHPSEIIVHPSEITVQPSEITEPPSQSLSFARLWTMKESLSKMIGHGLTLDWPRLQSLIDDHPEARFTTIVSEARQYVCTVCQNRP